MSHQRFLFGQFQSAETALTVEQALAICRKAQQQQKIFGTYPQDRVLALLSRVQQIWKDKNSNYRQQAVETLVQTTGFSKPMIELGMDELVWSLDANILSKKLEHEFRSIPLGIGEKFISGSKTILKHQPLGSLLHILSGNVFLVGPGSLIVSLITGNVTILKMPSEEKYFLPLFLKSLQECDSDGIVSQSIAAIDFASSQKEVIEVFKNQMDGIVIWGGEQAVQAYRNGAPARSRLIVFGPKLSFSMVTAKAIQQLGLQKVCQQLAEELVIWDQQACTAPQVCYVEGDGNAQELIGGLRLALIEKQKQLPPGEPSRDAAVEIRKIRSIAEVRQALGLGQLQDSGLNNLDFTLYKDKSLELEPSPLSRTIKIASFENREQVYQEVAGLRGYLQTVGLAATPHEWSTLVDEFSALGGLRVLPLGAMSGGEIDDPHDGQFDLPQMVNLVVARWPGEKGTAPFDFYSTEKRKELQSSKLRRLLMQAKKAPYFAKVLANLQIDLIDSMEDLQKIAFLDRLTWETRMFPGSSDLATQDPKGGYVTRSGGSTGAPKFSTFEKRDWQAMLDSAARMFEASGLNSEDRIANCMSAGDLYGSFLSFDHVNHHIGAMSFCFAQYFEIQSFVEICRKFSLTAMQGTPVRVMAMLREAKAIDPDFKMRKVMYAGMPMSESDRLWLQQNVGAERVISVIGTTEANHIGYQCSHLSRNEHHVVDDYNFIEILDENDCPAIAGQIGRLAVTNLEKYNFPVIRYLNGDAARWKTTPCACGRTTPVLEYMGRWDDIMSIGNMNIVYADLVKALSSLPVSQLQMVGQYGENKDALLLRIETAEYQNLSEEKIRSLLYSKIVDLEMMIANNTIELRIEILQSGSLPMSPRTGKIRNVIDERVR
jgi:phenylacetate-CoA ligase